MKKEIKIFNSFEIKDNKLCIDNLLFFDLNKLSFISDEVISTNPIENSENDSVISFYFSFVIDGILFEIRDQEEVFYTDDGKPPSIERVYPHLKVFELRKRLIGVFLS